MTTLDPFSLKKPWIEERAKISPDEPAIIWDRETISFGELYKCSLSRAKQLRASGIKPGDIIASLVENCPLAVEIFHAVQLCGATLLPLNIRLTAEEIAFQLEETDAINVIVGEENHLSTVRKACLKLECVPVLATELESERSISQDNFYRQEEYDQRIPWTILYTSGTTGTPKGVPLTVRHFSASAMASLAHLGVEKKDRWLACVPLFHIAGLSILTKSVLTGASVVLHKRFDAETVSRSIDEQQITLLSLVPTMLQRLVDVRLAKKKRRVSSLRAILIGGASCSKTLWQQALNLRLPVLRTYGLTEACSQVATQPLAEHLGDISSLPCKLEGVEVQIVDRNGISLGVFEEGEILVRGGMVMDHYHKRPEESTKVFQNGWLHTGDIGFLDNNGGLCVLDRRSDLIVSGGENIYPAEVEACLTTHPAVEEVCIVGEKDSEFGQRVVAWIVRRETFSVGEEELQQHCRRKLAGYKIPRKIIFIGRLPRNASGKVMRQHLKASSLRK